MLYMLLYIKDNVEANKNEKGGRLCSAAVYCFDVIVCVILQFFKTRLKKI